jgi:hypothetical protein
MLGGGGPAAGLRISVLEALQSHHHVDVWSTHTRLCLVLYDATPSEVSLPLLGCRAPAFEPGCRKYEPP